MIRETIAIAVRSSNAVRFDTQIADDAIAALDKAGFVIVPKEQASEIEKLRAALAAARDLDLAAKAIVEQDIPAMIAVYKSLKSYVSSLPSNLLPPKRRA